MSSELKSFHELALEYSSKAELTTKNEELFYSGEVIIFSPSLIVESEDFISKCRENKIQVRKMIKDNQIHIHPIHLKGN